MKVRLRGGRARTRLAGRCGWIGCLVLVGLGIAWGTANAQDIEWEGLSARFSFGEATELLSAIDRQTAPAVACDSALSSTSWVAWEDHRLGDPDIFVARVTAEGEVLEPTGLPLAAGPEVQIGPRLAAGGGVFLAIWQAADINQEAWRIEGARLDVDGQILDPEPILISESDYPVLDLDLAFGTESFMVVWSDTLGDRWVTRGTLVSAADGVVSNADPLVLCEEPRQQTGSDIAFDGEKYLMVYSRAVEVYDTNLAQGQITSIDTFDVGEIAGCFISQAGEPADTTLFITRAVGSASYTNDDKPMVGFAGGHYLVVWPARDIGQAQTDARLLFGRFVSPTGAMPAGRFGVETQNDDPREFRTIVPNGYGFQLAWVTLAGQARTTYKGVNVDLTGTQISAQEYEIVPRVGSRGIENPGGCDLAWTGENYLFVGSVEYLRTEGDDADIRTVFMDSVGTVLTEPAVISLAAPTQVPRTTLHDGSHYFTLWEEQVLNGWVLKGALVSDEGELSGGASFDVLPGDTLTARWNPSIARGDSGYVLAWAEDDELYTVRLDNAGQILSPRQLFSDDNSGNPAIGFDGERFALAWRSVTLQQLLLSRLEASGDSLSVVEYEVTNPDTSYVTHSATLLEGLSSDPVVVCNGAETMVLFAQTGQGVVGVAVADSSWEVPSPQMLAPGGDPRTPRAIYDEGSYFIAWSDRGAGYALRLRQDGIILDPGRIPLDLQSNTNDPPVVAHDGSNRLAIWRTSHGEQWALVGGRYGDDGMLVGGAIDFASEDLAARWPQAAMGQPGQTLVVYSTYLDDSDHGSMRLHGKLWQQQPPSVDIAIHQNPGVTSDVNIIVFPSEDIAEGVLSVLVNGAPIEMTLADETHNIYQGWYQARSTEVVRVVAAVGDSAGNLIEAERTFAIGESTPDEGGFLAGPAGAISLMCPPRALTTAQYLMILPEADVRRPVDPERGCGFTLSPPDVRLQAPVRLRIAVDALSPEACSEGWRPILERKTVHGWEPVAAKWLSVSRKLDASLDALGQFRMRWVPASADPSNHIALALGPDPWRTDLTLRYRLPQTGHVQLAVFDLTGRRVALLVDGLQEGGREHTMIWNGRDAGDRPVGSGVYFARLQVGEQVLTRRSILVR